MMKKVTWGIDQDVYDYLKEQAEKTGLSVQQTANLILKKYQLEIKIAPVEEKRRRGNPGFLAKEGKSFEEELKGMNVKGTFKKDFTFEGSDGKKFRHIEM